MPGIKRRNFLQGLGATALAGSLTGLVPRSASAMHSYGANPVLLNKRAGVVKYHSCLRNCADRCLMKFRVQDGRMTYVSGAEEQFKTGSCPCVKGLTYVEYTYAPDRILHPMERIGEKGSHKWRRISWEEAWDKLIKKTHEVIDKYGSEAILPYSYSGNYGAIGMRAADRFFNRVGASYLDRVVCTEAGVWGYGSVQGTTDGPDPEEIPNCDCYVSWGFNETVSNVHGIKLINMARDRGAKVLAVNPNRTPICSQADVYLQPKPATDAWVAVGVMKYLLAHEEMIDREFLDTCCIGADEAIARVNSVSWDDIVKVTGLERREIEKFADIYGKSKRCIIRGGYGMQRNYNGARMTRAIAIMHALRGMFDKPACGIIYDNVRPITGMNVFAGRGNRFIRKDIQHINMTDLDQALRKDKPTTEGRPIKPIHMLVCYNGNPVAVSPNVNELVKNLKRDDLYVVGFDMIMTDTLEYCDLILPASTQFETDDVIGDYHSWYVQICEKVIEPVGESKPNWDFFAEYGRRMGFTEQEFKDTPLDMKLPGFGKGAIPVKGGKPADLFTYDDWAVRYLSNAAEQFKGLPEVTDEDRRFAGLERAMKMVRPLLKPAEAARVEALLSRGGYYEADSRYAGEFMKNGGGKFLQFFNPAMPAVRHCFSGKPYPGVPVAEEARFFNGEAWRQRWSRKDYPLLFSSFKPILRSNYSVAFEHCTEISPENFVHMHRVTAQKFGLKNGDKVRIASPNGVDVKGVLMVDEAVTPGAVCVAHAYGHTAYGAENRVVDGKTVPGIAARAGGTAVNQMIPRDPTRPGRYGMLNDYWAACNCRTGIPVKVVKA